MMKTSNTGDLRRSSVMPGKGQIYKKPMKKMKRDPFAEGIDPSAGRGVPLSAYKEKAPKPKVKPVRSQTVNRAGKGNMKKKGK